MSIYSSIGLVIRYACALNVCEKYSKLLSQESLFFVVLLKANAATLDATERGVVQISFSCIHAWLRAAAAEILPAETMTRATPFNRLQGPGRMG